MKDLTDELLQRATGNIDKSLSRMVAKEKMTEQEFRQQVLQKFTEHKCLDFMFDQVKSQACKTHDVDGEAL